MAQPEIFGVDDVMRRYSLRDRRSARRLMDEAGGFMIAGRLVVRRDHLLAHEEALRAARRAIPGTPPPAAGPSRHAGRPTASRRSEPLPPGWWREEPGGDRDAA